MAVLLGSLAGFIDSIAGGGGLVTLPTLTLLVGPGAHAIGSNKIVGTVGAFTALLVYSRGKHVDWSRSLAFTLWVGLGSMCGSLCSPLVPTWLFQYLLAATCPVILFIVWRKDLWVTRELVEHPAPRFTGWLRLAEPRVLAAGLACGFYDGLWGPGGGTFMFLGLLFAVRMPLLAAIAASKFANTASAGTALLTYQLQGYVHWKEGLLVASGMTVGAFFGARFATRKASQAVRPVLVAVVILLLFRLFNQR